MGINWKALIPAAEALIQAGRSEEDIVDELIDVLVQLGYRDTPFRRATARFLVGDTKPGARAKAALERAQRRVDASQERLKRIKAELKEAKGEDNVDRKKVAKAIKAVKRAEGVLANWEVRLKAAQAALESGESERDGD